MDQRLEIQKKRNYKVVKANEIIQKARYELGLLELKSLAYILSMVKPNDGPRTIYTFSIKEYCEICGIDTKSGRNYEMAKNSLKKLRDTSFYLMNEDGTETTVGWLEKIWIMGLVNNYTQYELLCTLPMRSRYSFKLYELLKSYAFTKGHTFDIDKLKLLLNAKNYVNFKDFRKKVLEISIKEINLYTDLEINYEPIYKGRKVVKVAFDIKQRNVCGRYYNSINATDALDGQMDIYDYIGDNE